MKLRLNYDRGAAILDVFEDVSMQNLEALKAGLTSLLKAGRKLIVIDLSTARGVDVGLASELLKLGIVSSGFGGQLALIGHGEQFRKAVQLAKSGSAPLAKLYSGKSAAISALTGSANEPPVSQLKQRLVELTAENQLLKAKAATLGPSAGAGPVGELRALQKANSRLEREIACMNEMLAGLAQQKPPARAPQLLDRKIEAFERVLVHLLTNDGLLKSVGNGQ